LIPAGNFTNGKFKLIDDEEHYASTTIGYLKLPITSVKGFSGFVKQITTTLRRPPHGIVAKVKVVPDASSQFKVLFEPLMNVPDSLMGVIMKRREEAVAAIEFPYPAYDEVEAKPKKPTVAKGRKVSQRKY